MPNNQGGLNGIDAISGGASTMNLSSLQGMVPNYSFGDITRANFGKGSEIAQNMAFNASELFLDNNAVGINPFFRPEIGQGSKFHSIG